MAWLMRGALTLVLGLLAMPAAQAAERILSFDSTITVNGDGTLQVRERIRVRAEGENIKRGIYREFPTVYQGQGGRQVMVGFAFESATRNGAPETWREEPRCNGVRIYLGKADVFLDPGSEHTYELVYRTDRQMGFFADHDELYWNVTGNGWDFPIESATARVLLPAGIPRADVSMEAYTGAFGAQGGDYQARLDADAPYYSATRPLGRREGLTIVASWPKGHISPGVENPSAVPSPVVSGDCDPGGAMARVDPHRGWSPVERMLGRRVAPGKLPLWLAIAGFLGLLGYYYVIWDKVGRDPPGKVIIPEYAPPADQTPASMRYITRMGYDNECFGAAILSLAVKGYLRIEQDAGILGLGKKFTLHRQPKQEQGLPADERALLDKLFAGGSTLVLEQANHSRIRGARSAHAATLKHLYSAGFFRINGGWHFLGIVASLLVLALSVAWPGESENWPEWYLTTLPGWITAGLALAALVLNGLFGVWLRAPTPRGRLAMDHIKGFKMYLEVAEGEELKRVSAPPPPLTPQLYEAYLPAALALDVEQNWAERFASVLDVKAPDYRPAWYVGPGFNARNLAAFSTGLSSSLNSAISSSSTPPGSSSGRGGGGSSGGGGGGGGGGGW
jgi:uncharacterized membrane protein YgcG